MKMLRHRETGEVMPMNADTARNDNMVPVEVPDPEKMISYNRGVAYIEEQHIFGARDDDAPAEPAPKRKSRVKAKPKQEPELADVELGSPDEIEV
jgi:hypothetical protein